MAQEQQDQQDQDDPIWRTAWAWVRRERDREDFDDAARADMVAWLLADPAHRKAYEKAARLLLLAGLVPARLDVEAWKKNQSTPGDAAPGDDDT
jgi:ferric-dicitrate binding protein FerR (iron transport regulator)